MSVLAEFDRVTRASPCPVCNKSTWCLVAPDGSKALCQRVESERRWRDAGWFHRLKESGPRAARASRASTPRSRSRSFVSRVRLSPRPLNHFRDRAEAYAVTADARVEELAIDLGVSPLSLIRLRIAVNDNEFWFPMCDGEENVIGIRTRSRSGAKKAITGSWQGLFIPTDLPNCFGEERLFLPEGPTDTAALLDLGFLVVGRPSCSTGEDHVVRFVKARGVEHAVVVADPDDPGRKGAASLAIRLRPYCRSVQILEPPPGIKDAREWVRQGAREEDIEFRLRSASEVQLTVRVREAAQ